MAKLPQIVVRRYGNQGREVAVLHGGPGAPGSASGLAKLLSPEHRVLEPLQRRSGLVPLTVARHVEDLAEVIPEACAIVGHSWGAMLGLSYAARYPDRVSRLVLVNSGTYDEASRNELGKTIDLRLGDVGKKKVVELRSELMAAKDKPTKDRILSQLGSIFAIVDSYELIEDVETERDELPADSQGHDETWTDAMRLQSSGVEPESFSAIQCPVILIAGNDDPHPGAMTAELLRKHIAHLEYLGLERCGHEPWRERYAKDVFLEALRVWLRR